MFDRLLTYITERVYGEICLKYKRYLYPFEQISTPLVKTTTTPWIAQRLGFTLISYFQLPVDYLEVVFS